MASTYLEMTYGLSSSTQPINAINIEWRQLITLQSNQIKFFFLKRKEKKRKHIES